MHYNVFGRIYIIKTLNKVFLPSIIKCLVFSVIAEMLVTWVSLPTFFGGFPFFSFWFTRRTCEGIFGKDQLHGYQFTFFVSFWFTWRNCEGILGILPKETWEWRKYKGQLLFLRGKLILLPILLAFKCVLIILCQKCSYLVLRGLWLNLCKIH